MSYDDLTLADLMEMARQCSELAAERMREIAGRSDPSDVVLVDLLKDLARVQQQRVAAMRRLAPKPGESGELSPTSARARLLSSELRKLRGRMGDGTLVRDQALYLAESVAEEASRLHRTLALHAPSREASSFFQALSDAERALLHHLRAVILS